MGIYTKEVRYLAFTHYVPIQCTTLLGAGFEVKSIFIALLIAATSGLFLSSESFSPSGILPGPDRQ